MSLLACTNLLLHAGFTKYELREAANEVKKIQKIVNFQKNTILFMMLVLLFDLLQKVMENILFRILTKRKKISS